MTDIFIRIKAIVKQDDKFLVLEHWMDDCIVEPYVWEFVDFDLEKGESPVQATHRGVYDAIGMDVEQLRPLYTWSQMIGEMQCIGIAYLCELTGDGSSLVLSDEYSNHKWIEKEELATYIQNKNMLRDLQDNL